MDQVLELSYALDTFYFLVCGALVMWMAAGFTMLEGGPRARQEYGRDSDQECRPVFHRLHHVHAVRLRHHVWRRSTALFPGISMLSAADNAAADVIAGGDDAPYYSALSDFFFQVVFVATAMSIVSGAVAERMKLWSFFAFAVVLTGFIYPIQGYWKWGGGFLDELGFLDFAGSGVVHMCGAAAALAGVILLGARKGKYTKSGQVMAIPGSNLPLATLGTLILWLGWFGFNGGSELKVSDVGEANAVALVFVNTNMAAAGGLVAALLLARFWFGKADLTMALNGALAGLVAITAEPLTPAPMLATFIGAIGGLLVVPSIVMMDRWFKIDDPVGAISVHGVVGIWGLLAVCLSNPDAITGEPADWHSHNLCLGIQHQLRGLVRPARNHRDSRLGRRRI